MEKMVRLHRSSPVSQALGEVPGIGPITATAMLASRGDTYLRTLLIHGARAVVKAAAKKNDAQSRWINDLVRRRNTNIAAVAVANKNARIAWALLVRGETYRTPTVNA